jgi:hypothetical protein
MQTQTETVFFSRYPGEPTIEQPVLFFIPADPDMVSIHPHRLEPGRWLVVEWVRCPIHRFRQIAVTNVASITNAREYAPPGSELRYRGAWGEAWVVRRGAVRS